MLKCHHCQHDCKKDGHQKNGNQKYRCKSCKKYQQASYSYRACSASINSLIIQLTKEGCGIRSIARILKISVNTVIKRIRNIASQILKPKFVVFRKSYEADELKTYIGNKQNKYWVAYAINRGDKSVIDYKVGKRTKKTLSGIIETLLLAQAKKIYTDGLDLYKYLIPASQHKVKEYRINHIERQNLNLRTHLKRLSRKTICYSKKTDMLEACLKIYWWG